MTRVVRDLCAAVADLTGPPTGRERLEATGRLVALASILVAGAWLYWGLPLGPAALTGLVVAGVAYALLLIATHELVHGTLLGWSSVEGSLGCLLSWPMAWPFLTYSRLHHLHHRWNGRDPRDPERTEVLPQEWDGGSRWHRLWQHHQLLLRCGLLGGLGLIADTARKGWQLRALDRSLLRSQILDGAGVVLLHSALLVPVLWHGQLWRYLLFWLVLERVIGAIVQARGLVEHHGLWRNHGGHLLTQLYATRNVAAGGWLNALMGGLPHHSAHHAFPWIPTPRLPEATARITAVLANHGLPALAAADSCGAALRELVQDKEDGIPNNLAQSRQRSHRPRPLNRV